MYSATPLLSAIRLHGPVPGIICLILAAFLLSCWEFRRLTRTKKTAVDWWLPAVAVTAGVISFALITLRFIGIA